MSLKSILKDCKITRVMNAVAAGTSAQSTTALDMSGYNSVIYIALLGTVTDGSILTLTAFDNAANSNSGGTAVSGGAAAAYTAASDSNHYLVTDVIRPTGRYSYAQLTRTAQNAAIDGILAIQYNADTKPVAQPAALVAAALSTPEV